jgi:hypothetical protein
MAELPVLSGGYPVAYEPIGQTNLRRDVPILASNRQYTLNNIAPGSSYSFYITATNSAG